ncbi:MAG: hypothetical protein E4H13_06285 [Calditrichales bacterium]|nr:MAG: hypothetical protein E4H13_06285 [Calditrichales bacterium]
MRIYTRLKIYIPLICLLIIYGLSAQNKTKGNTLPFDFVLVPAGEFTYGQDAHHLHLAYDFKIMKYEVTNMQYVKFLNAKMALNEIYIDAGVVEGAYDGDSRISPGTYVYLDMKGQDSECKVFYKNGKFGIEPGFETHPVVDVTWFGANAFARDYQCRLPTEEEWEKAARGNTGWNFPWGDQADQSHANYFDSGDPYDNGTTPVGYYNGSKYGGFQTTDSPSPYGAYDLAGNVWEWTNSFYSATSEHRVIRGGSWGYSTFVLPSWVRFNGFPYQGPQVGFRLVKIY